MKKDINKRRKMKMGAYQTAIMLIVIVVVIVFNMLIAKMDMKVDMNTDELYTLSEDSKTLLNELDSDVTIYYLCEEGKETMDFQEEYQEVLTQYGIDITYKTVDFEQIVNLYGEYDRVSVQKKNPVLYPNCVKEYTDAEISNNEIVVVNEKTKKSEHIVIDDIIVKDSSLGSLPVGINLEAKVSSAIKKTANPSQTKVYITEGHGEEDATLLQDFIENSAVDVESLKTTEMTAIPGDCELLIVFASKYDFTQEEYTMIKSYFEKGGKGMFFLNPAAESYTNFNQLLADYGVQASNYVVYETDSSYQYKSNTTILKPAIAEGQEVDTECLIAGCLAIGQTEKLKSTLTVEPILTTSDKAFGRSVSSADTSATMTDTDIAGPFHLAMRAEDEYPMQTIAGADATRIVVFSSYTFVDENFFSTNQFGNRTLMANNLKWLLGDEAVSNDTLNITERKLYEVPAVISETDRNVWVTVLVFIVPIALLLGGVLIWNRRRKK